MTIIFVTLPPISSDNPNPLSRISRVPLSPFPSLNLLSLYSEEITSAPWKGSISLFNKRGKKNNE